MLLTSSPQKCRRIYVFYDSKKKMVFLSGALNNLEDHSLENDEFLRKTKS